MAFDQRTRDLDDCEHPDQVSKVLRNAAQRFYEDQMECQAAWQDKNAGRGWALVARKLEKLADALDKMDLS